MHLDVPENKRLKIEAEQYNSDDDFSDYMKSGNPEVDVEKKKRRGKIEKRRRDRINNSLTELKELVPSAVAKQNTTKLEKAEILKLTVDYLKELKSKDPTRFFNGSSHIYESRLTGFRECLNEISKYLLHREGMSNQSPLYQGLMEHLQYCYQCFATQVAYQQDTTLSTDPTQRYVQMQSQFMAFDSPPGQVQHDVYQKLPYWPGSLPTLYPNSPAPYANHALQSNPFSFQCNISQNSSQYDLSVPSTISNTISGSNMPFNSMFKFPSSAGSVPGPINHVNNLSPNQPVTGSLFNSFCNAPNTYFRHISNDTTRDSLA